MNTQVFRLLTMAVLSILFSSLSAQTTGTEVRSEFTARSGTFAGVTLPYREATFQTEKSAPRALVIYLHGGTSKGDDNEAQMGEAGVDSIADYLAGQSWPSVMLVPQCPTNQSWSGRMLVVLRQLIASYTSQSAISPMRVYLFGGSMGGTGTWSMLSSYPHLFAAAMPVAGNPSRCNADSVALTPVFTVMGTADKIMSVSTVEDFTAQLTTAGGEWRMEVEEGWTHEVTCIESYTTERLDWVFSHVRNNSTDGIQGVTTASVVASDYFTLSGQQVNKPLQRGVYVVRERHADGSTTVNRRLLPTK